MLLGESTTQIFYEKKILITVGCCANQIIQNEKR